MQNKRFSFLFCGLVCGVVWCVGCKNDQAHADKGNPKAVLKTNKGSIELELFQREAPLSTDNFKAYCTSGFYDGTIFHRVISNFMVQGGGMTPEMMKKPTRSPIKNEAANGLKNVRGTLAMARTGIVDSATAQFFINVVDNHFLDHKAPNPQQFGYAVFGKVTRGMDVVDAIRYVRTGNQAGHQHVPLEPVVIISCTWQDK